MEELYFTELVIKEKKKRKKKKKILHENRCWAESLADINL